MPLILGLIYTRRRVRVAGVDAEKGPETGGKGVGIGGTLEIEEALDGAIAEMMILLFVLKLLVVSVSTLDFSDGCIRCRAFT